MDEPPKPQTAPLRLVWFLLGWIMVGLGVIGALLPVMPTTVFLICAAWCFGRSSPRLERWMLNHPRFGAPLRAWRERGAVPRRAKYAATAGMTFGYAFFLWSAAPRPAVALLVLLPVVASALYLLTRPD